jgi:membrane-associated phospholipid phosphatase
LQLPTLVPRVWWKPRKSSRGSAHCIPKAGSMKSAAWFEKFDQQVDNALEHIRDHKFVVIVFSIASAVGDFGLLWHIIGLLRSIGSMDRLNQALFFSLMIGIESLILNQGIKRLFRRSRPTERGDQRFALRKPRTSSFPSGHASSAFFSALVLTYFTTWPWAILFYAFALIIATSRVGVRIHHASDVIGGAVVGTLMGIIGLVVLNTLAI